METVIPASAPPDSTPTTISASEAAVEKQSFADFRDAERAKETGKPLPPVEQSFEDLENKPPVISTDGRSISKRQEKQNEAIREAVARATAEKDTEIARLRAAVPPPAAAPVTTSTAAAVPEWKRIAALPNAPKLSDTNPDGTAVYATLEEFNAAQNWFIDDVRQQQRQAQTAEAKAVESVTQTITGYQGRIAEAGGKPFLDALIPEVQQLRPIESLIANGEPQRNIGPRNVLTSEIIKSASAPQLLKHFSDHPDELKEFDGLKNSTEVLIAFGKVLAKVDAPTQQAALKTVTSASPPPTTLSTARSAAPADAVAAAVNRNDFRAFRDAERAARRA